MPVCEVYEVKSPGDIFPGNPRFHMRIFGDIPTIIKIYKVMGRQLPIGRKYDDNQKQTNDKFPTRFIFNIKHYKRNPE